jgi:transposase
MPDDQAIIGLPGFKILKVIHRNPLIFEVCCEIVPVCPHCNSEKLRVKDTFLRKLRHESFGVRLSRLDVRTHKYHCQGCLRYFNQRLPGVMPYARATEPFKREVCSKHEHGISQRTLQQELKMGNATVERWYQRAVDLKMREVALRRCPQILGIDEHFFTRKKGYATTFVDLKLHKVFDVVLGRSEASLKTFLERLEGRDRVKVVVMDLSETYRSIIKKYFPNAMIVADRFHVIRLINHHFLKAWQHFDETGRKNRGLLSLMRRHRWNLSEEQMEKLDRYLFKEMPVMGAIYDFKQQLCEFMLIKSITTRDVRRYARPFLTKLAELKDHPVEPLRVLGRTLMAWLEEIVRMWRFTKTNSITEGLHTKMEMISRRAYGFRNFKNYRLRVIVLCS